MWCWRFQLGLLGCMASIIFLHYFSTSGREDILTTLHIVGAGGYEMMRWFWQPGTLLMTSLDLSSEIILVSLLVHYYYYLRFLNI